MKIFFYVLCLFSLPSFANELPTYTLTLKNHRFTPTELKVKANQKFKLVVVNQDNAFEEFESKKMVIEKFVNPKGKLNLVVGPLKPGTYDFFGEFHMSTAKGNLIAE
jgi:hypothetical protein